MTQPDKKPRRVIRWDFVAALFSSVFAWIVCIFLAYWWMVS